MELMSNSFVSIEQMQGTYLQEAGKGNRYNSESSQPISFREVLEQVHSQKENVNFSKHANERLLRRNIQLDDNQIERLNDGVRQAKEKNINESLVMMDNLAFIVNIKNNTVITAMDQETNDSNIFTNIDGAVIV